jgi:hypothetical protein
MNLDLEAFKRHKKKGEHGYWKALGWNSAIDHIAAYLASQSKAQGDVGDDLIEDARIEDMHDQLLKTWKKNGYPIETTPMLSAVWGQFMFKHRNAIRASLASRAKSVDLTGLSKPQEGWVLVPREPNEDMIRAAWDGNQTDDGQFLISAIDAYKAMIAAAPSQKEG